MSKVSIWGKRKIQMANSSINFFLLYTKNTIRKISVTELGPEKGRLLNKHHWLMKVRTLLSGLGDLGKGLGYLLCVVYVVLRLEGVSIAGSGGSTTQYAGWGPYHIRVLDSKSSFIYWTVKQYREKVHG